MPESKNEPDEEEEEGVRNQQISKTKQVTVFGMLIGGGQNCHFSHGHIQKVTDVVTISRMLVQRIFKYSLNGHSKSL